MALSLCVHKGCPTDLAMQSHLLPWYCSGQGGTLMIGPSLAFLCQEVAQQHGELACVVAEKAPELIKAHGLAPS